MSQNSRIFGGYRALGVNSDHVPCVIRYNQKHQETYVVTSVGKAFHVYKCSNMGLVRVSDSLEDDINCLGVDSTYIYAASKQNIYAFLFGRKIVKVYKGHESDVHQILPFGAHLVSVDQENVVKVWDIESTEAYLTLNFAKETFEITCLLHPITYLNKILFASRQGSMQLWNIKSSQLIYSYKSFDVDQSAITVLKQAPALDVVGVGLESGKIILHNLKFDQTVMSFVQEWGPIRSLTFRTDGNPIMISGSNLGHMAIWNLEEKRLVAQIREAHCGSVDGMHALHLEPLMVTSSGDNSVKVWIFDMSDGAARLLRHRSGHSQAPSFIRFHDAQSVLSAAADSRLMSFSTVHDSRNKSLGRASFNKTESRKSGLRLDEHKMPPIVQFSTSEAKQSDWDSVICVHENLRMATTWDYVKSTMGKHKLEHQRFKDNERMFGSVVATCCTISQCGNYCVIGYSSGHVDLYNMQSGAFRGEYGGSKQSPNGGGAHECSVRGVATDSLNLTTITCGEDGHIRFWPFKEKKSLQSRVVNWKHELNLEESIDKICLHRESGMLAVATDDFNIVVIDCDLKRVVRRFTSAHSNRISDLTFSPDSRWLVSSSMDCLVKVWDLPSSKLIDCFRFHKAPTSVCYSPSSEFLATTHVNDLGIYLWSNKTLYSHVALRQLPDDYEPSDEIKMPSTRLGGDDDDSDSDHEDNQDGVLLDDDYKNYTSPDQLALDLVTLSLLPESRWKNLVNLDIIKKRNKPIEPPKKPKLAPFFLPTVANEQGFSFKTTTDETDTTQSTLEGKFGSLSLFLSDFAVKLSKSTRVEHYKSLLEDLKKMGPSAIDVEIRSLGEDMGGGVELMQRFLQFIVYVLSTRRHFELANSYLALFLKVHGETVARESELVSLLEQIGELQSLLWTSLQLSFNKSLCLVGYLKSSV